MTRTPMNFNAITIRQDKAPVCHHSKSGTSRWKDLFESMRVSEWFTLNQEDYMKTSQAATKYMRGRYRLYKHPEQTDVFIFQKIK